MMAKKILLIGGNGYIGSRLTHDLQYTYEIQSIDICWFGKNLGFSDIIDYNLLTKEYIKKFDVVVLLAGHSSVKMCQGEASSSWNNNVNNFINLTHKLDKDQTLIYASSGSVYGDTHTATNEDTDLIFNPINNYDLTKYTLDTIAQSMILKGYNIVGLRFGTVNGWSPNVREELMINSMTKHSIETGNIIINNKHIVRPILGISDISRAIDAIIKKPISGIYNLASFYDSVENLSSQISSLLSSNINVQPDVIGSYDFIMDTTKFQKTFDFEFKETVNTIVNELSTKFDHTTFSNRNQFLKYE
jgi:nucleoside-diphosphate-sugar epimerase